MNGLRLAPGDYVYYEGKHLTAEWYYTEGGWRPAYASYQCLTAVEQERLDMMVKFLCDSPPGTILPKTLCRLEDPAHKIYALKPRDERFFNFTAAGGKIILTNACRKDSQKRTRQGLEALKAAVWFRNDYFTRLKREAYYER